MMYELSEQDHNVRFESKFPTQDVGLMEAEEKCLEPLLEVKSEPQEVNEDFGEGKAKCDFTIKGEEGGTKPFAEDQIQKACYKKHLTEKEVVDLLNADVSDIKIDGLSSDDESDKTYQRPQLVGESDFSDSESSSNEEATASTCDVAVHAPPDPDAQRAEQGTSRLRENVKHRRMLWYRRDFIENPWPKPLDLIYLQGIKEIFDEVDPIKVEEAETKPIYQLMPIVIVQNQVLYDMTKNENTANYDNTKSKEDQKLISRVYDRSRTPSIHGNYVNVEPDRNCDTNYSASCNTRIHTDTLPYTCEVCGKSFNERSSLNRHTRFHTGKGLFSCEVCGKCFNRRGDLKTHLRIHTGDRPFSCEACGKSFNQIGHLKTHLRIHTGDRPFYCEVCGISFNQRSNLKRHLRIHTDSRPGTIKIPVTSLD